MPPLAIGIDLGTTNSALAHVNASGRPEVVPNAEGNPITPSVVFFGSDPPLVGDQAKEMQALGEQEVASFFKRSMGDPYFLPHLGGRDRTAVELSALVLRKLKSDAEASLRQAVERAVITVPAYFNNAQREATIEAGRQAGLEVLQIINEPTAAALAYRVGESGRPETILVYDLGGGTFDVSLVEATKEELTVLATAGDHNLGGKDWDDRVAAFLGRRFAERHGSDPLDDRGSFNDLLVRAEDAKKALSARDSTRVTIHHGGLREAIELTRSTFEELTRDLMERTQSLCEQVLQDRGLAWGDLTGVLLVGGSTRMPMVHDYVGRMSGKRPMTGVNVDEAVALGAAVMAAKLQDAAGKGREPIFSLAGARKVRDVMSHSLGVVALNEARDGYINSIIIRKNTGIPCQESKSYQVSTRRDQDNHLDVYMLQGESEDPKQCSVVGKYVFSDVAHEPKAPAVIEIEYGYDASGVIRVTAKQLSSGKDLPLRVEPLSDGMSWLANVRTPGRGGLRSPYTVHAGQHHIPGALTDKHGNAQGSQYDLAEDHAFEDHTIAVLHLYTGEGFDFKLPEQALREKGFALHRWTQAPKPRELERVLEEACQLWLISDRTCHLSGEHVSICRKFFETGRGVYIWGDNEPYYADANQLAKALIGCTFSGNSHGDQVVRHTDGAGRPGFTSHLIMTGIEHLYEGHTVATVCGSSFEPLVCGSDGNPLIGIYDEDGKRAIVDGGFTRLYIKWDTAGTGRYVKNAASWLVNVERIWSEPKAVRR